jgi:hypothetical protein
MDAFDRKLTPLPDAKFLVSCPRSVTQTVSLRALAALQRTRKLTVCVTGCPDEALRRHN